MPIPHALTPASSCHRTSSPLGLGVAAIAVLVSLLTVVDTASAQQAAFSTANGRIECSATQGIYGSGVNCYRLSDGLVAIVQWSGTSVSRRGGTKSDEPVYPGTTLRPGRSRTLRFPDATYRCTAQTIGRIRCTHLQKRFGFVLGMRVAKRFR